MRRVLVTVCLLALALAGCGAAPRDSAKDFKGDEQTVAKAVERLEKAARDDDPGFVCKQLLSTKLLAALSKQGTNCNTAVKEAFKDADSVDLTVDDVAIQGTSATAKVKYRSLSKDKTATLLLDRVGTAWKISSLGSAA
jgi:glutamate dehydrogenase/leucine dehydrogenase